MNEHIRLEHRVEMGGRYHAYTSPDLKGFYVTGETNASAQREAIKVLDLIASERGAETPEIEFVKPPKPPAPRSTDPAHA